MLRPLSTGAERVAKRKRFLKCSKFLKPRPNLRKSLIFLFIDSMGPLERRLSYSPPGPTFRTMMKEFMIESLCFSRREANSLKISYLELLYLMISSSSSLLAASGFPAFLELKVMYNSFKSRKSLSLGSILKGFADVIKAVGVCAAPASLPKKQNEFVMILKDRMVDSSGFDTSRVHSKTAGWTVVSKGKK